MKSSGVRKCAHISKVVHMTLNVFLRFISLINNKETKKRSLPVRHSRKIKMAMVSHVVQYVFYVDSGYSRFQSLLLFCIYSCIYWVTFFKHDISFFIYSLSGFSLQWRDVIKTFHPNLVGVQHIVNTVLWCNVVSVHCFLNRALLPGSDPHYGSV